MDRYRLLFCGNFGTYSSGGADVEHYYEVPVTDSTTVGGGSVLVSPKAVSSHTQSSVSGFSITNGSDLDAAGQGTAVFSVKYQKYNQSTGSLGTAVYLFANGTSFKGQTFSCEKRIQMAPGDRITFHFEGTSVIVDNVQVQLNVYGIEMSYGYGPRE
jgi:hypothetical protein